MKLNELIEKYQCRIHTPHLLKEKNIKYAFCSDLMSDALIVMNSIKDERIFESSILITGLTTNQSIRTAEMLDVEVVLLVRGKLPSTKVVDLAIDSGIILLSTDHTMFNISGMLYQDGIKGIISNIQW